ncbi:MAG: DUF5063 domain-containing protein [Bacteroidaceae bacterium]|nr:DUF5063 domain-containing protein [Bacteroidaceae bacterium]
MTQNILYSNKCIEFLTVSSEYCKYLEQAEASDRNEFNDVVRGLLVLIYLKASLLPEFDEPEGYNEPKVTEADYNYIRNKVALIMKELDDYLDVFVEDFKYTDQPILCTISEGIADIYQVLRELTETYKNAYDEAIHAQLFDVKETFQTEWGQTLLNTIKALHDSRFTNG